MMKEAVFINFTNHPSGHWEEKQREQAEHYGRIVDVPFPDVDAAADEEYIITLANTYVAKIMEYQPHAVLCQGEFCLAYQVISKLKALDVPVLAACSERCVREIGNKKEVVFDFVRFRRY